ncbi:MAG: hypothetical protein H7A48_03945 [Akkermansiaceae bacterium]|nr:hypothetical protein [Akkermansiaceae bacterium]
MESIPVSDEYVLRTWEVADGLPSNTVSGIAQTPDGYLWLATSIGLVRFDGERFTPFLQGEVDGLETNRVMGVYVAGDGTLWVGLDRGGVARRTGNRFETIIPCLPIGASGGWTCSFAQEADGAVWFGRGLVQEVFRWKNGSISAFTGKDGIGPGAGSVVYAETNGRVWFSTLRGFGVFDGKRFLPMDLPSRGKMRLAPANDGGMWMTQGEHLMRYRADGSFETVASLGNMSVNALHEDHAGDLWIGTSDAGLFRFRRGDEGKSEGRQGGDLVRIPTSHTAVSATVSSIMEDREGNLWVGTQGGGLNRLHPSRFFLRTTKHGLSIDNTVSLCEDTEGRLWLAGIDGTLVRSLASDNRSFAKPEGWEFGGILAMCPDPAGGVWLGVSTGLVRWRDGDIRQEAFREPVTALLPGRHGVLWLATLKSGLVRWRNGSAERISGVLDLTEPRALAEDATGRLWVGTESGRVFLCRNEPSAEPRFEPVPLPGTRLDDQIRFIVPDGPETVWIGAWNSGLYRWRSGRVERLPHGSGMPLHDLHTMVIEPDGNCWFGTSGGIFRVARSEIEAVLDGKRQSMFVVAYGRNDGMPNVDVNLGFKNTATRTRDGHLWFATSRGAMEIRPQEFRKAVPPLPLLIEEIQVGNEVLSANGHLTLPPKPGPLQIRYTLPELSAPERIRFRYRLIGMEETEWIPADTQRTATLTHLPPGDYRFEVTATDADGAWLPKAASISFSVRAAWWETFWFRFGSWLLGMCALGWLVRLIVKRRMRARLRRLAQERALERERIRIARDMHDQLGASLTQIAITSKLLKLDPPESVAAHSDELANIARNTVESLDELVWAVDPANDTLATSFDYLCQFAVDFLATAGIACELDVPMDLPARPVPSHVRHHLFLAVKESLNNIVKHSGASAVRLNIEIIGENLRLTIADNGHGFEQGNGRAGSDGLRNMRARMTELGGSCEVESHPGEGTQVILQLPLPPAAA